MGDTAAGPVISWGGVSALGAGVSLLLFFIPALEGSGGGSMLWTVVMVTLTTFSVIFAPAPLMWAYRRGGAAQGRAATLVALVAAWVLSSTLLPLPGGGMNFFYYAVVAAAVGEVLARGWSEETALAAALAAALVVLGGIAMVLGPLSGQGLGEFVRSQVDPEINALLAVYRDSGMDAATVKMLGGVLRGLIKLTPGILAAASLLLVWANLVASRINQPPPEPARSLTLWRAPEVLVWFFIVAVVLVVATRGWLFWLGANLLIATSAVYLLQGIAVLAFWLQKKKIPRPARAAIYTAVVLMELVLLLLVAAGLFDMWFDFRRLKANAAA